MFSLAHNSFMMLTKDETAKVYTVFPSMCICEFGSEKSSADQGFLDPPMGRYSALESVRFECSVLWRMPLPVASLLRMRAPAPSPKMTAVVRLEKKLGSLENDSPPMMRAFVEEPSWINLRAISML